MWGSPPSRDDPKATRRHSRHSKTSASMEIITVKNLDEDADQNGAHGSFAMDSLLRLFRSDFFDAFMAVTYLYRYREARGVNDYLCNELYVLSDADLEAFMPQLCNLLVHHAQNSPGLERFVMDKCASSMHFAVQVFWFLQAAVEDAVREGNKKAEARCRLLRTHCETAAVNGSQHVIRAALGPHPLAEVKNSIAEVNRLRSVSEPVLEVKENLRDSPASVEIGTATSKKLANGSSEGECQPTLGEIPGPSESFNFEGAPIMCSDELSALESQDNEADDDVPDTSAPMDLSSDDSDLPGPDLLAEAQVVEEPSTAQPADVQEAEEVAPEVSQTDVVPNGVELTNTTNAVEEAGDMTTSAALDLMDAFASEPVSDSMLDNAGHPGDPISHEENSEKTRPVAALPSTSTSDVEVEEQKSTASVLREEEKSAVKKIRADAGALLSLDMDPITLVRMKQERFDYFTDSLAIVRQFVQLSLSTREKPENERQSHLSRGLQSVNEMLLRRMSGDSAIPLVVGTPAPPAKKVAELGLPAALRSIHLPLTRANSQVLRILRVHEVESVILTSRTRAPYMLYIEVLPTPMTCSDRLVFCEHIAVAHSPDPQQDKLRATSSSDLGIPSSWNMSSPDELEATSKASAEKPKRKRKLSEMTPRERQRANVRATIYGDAYSDQPYEFSKADEEEELDPDSTEYKVRQAALLAVFGELWSWKEERILKNSPFSVLKNTRLMSFIVKAGDDLRQEQLAIQLIKQFELIFKEEDVDVFLRPFTVMSVSSDAGLVEVMPDSVSVHSLKARTPNFISLLDYFERAYGKKETQSFRAAQRRFIRSMAGYSLVTYFLQIKDRHNGNIMLDARGHIVHIDFGFMLTNSPGSIKFENAPFKLTEEYLQVICAMKNVSDINKTSKTEGFRYFQELFVLGLLAARKHHEKITTLVRIMMDGTSMPCMAAGHSVIDSLEHRFVLRMPEQQCISHAISLIESSRLSLRSVGYDRFQAYSNGYQ